jgi:hypothetical protein
VDRSQFYKREGISFFGSNLLSLFATTPASLHPLTLPAAFSYPHRTTPSFIPFIWVPEPFLIASVLRTTLYISCPPSSFRDRLLFSLLMFPLASSIPCCSIFHISFRPMHHARAFCLFCLASSIACCSFSFSLCLTHFPLFISSCSSTHTFHIAYDAHYSFAYQVFQLHSAPHLLSTRPYSVPHTPPVMPASPRFIDLARADAMFFGLSSIPHGAPLLPQINPCAQCATLGVTFADSNQRVLDQQLRRDASTRRARARLAAADA